MNRRSWYVSGLLATVAVSGGAGVAQAGTYQTANHAEYHRSLASEAKFQSVGQIRTYDEDGAHIASASGVLIGRDWVLTSAHVLEEAAGVVFGIGDVEVEEAFNHPFDPAGPVSALVSWTDTSFGDSWYTHRSYDGNILRGYDLALVKLGSTINSAIPTAKLAGPGSKLEFGKTVDIAGRGASNPAATGADDADFDYNLVDGSFASDLRAGRNVIDGQLAATIPAYIGPNGLLAPIDPRISVLDMDPDPRGPNAAPGFDDGEFNLDDYPVQFEYNPAIGDSGGGIFLDDTLVGIVSGGFDGGADDSGFNGLTFNTRVRPFYKWIKRVMRYVDRGGSVFTPNKVFQRWGDHTVDADGEFVGDILEVDPLADETDSDAYGKSSASAVPEPATALLIGGALAGMLVRRNRRAD